jgi:hypothetical protein
LIELLGGITRFFSVLCKAWWYIPVIPNTQKAGGSRKIPSLKPAQAKLMRLSQNKGWGSDSSNRVMT